MTPFPGVTMESSDYLRPTRAFSRSDPSLGGNPANARVIAGKWNANPAATALPAPPVASASTTTTSTTPMVAALERHVTFADPVPVEPSHGDHDGDAAPHPRTLPLGSAQGTSTFPPTPHLATTSSGAILASRPHSLPPPPAVTAADLEASARASQRSRKARNIARWASLLQNLRLWMVRTIHAHLTSPAYIAHVSLRVYSNWRRFASGMLFEQRVQRVRSIKRWQQLGPLWTRLLSTVLSNSFRLRVLKLRVLIHELQNRRAAAALARKQQARVSPPRELATHSGASWMVADEDYDSADDSTYTTTPPHSYDSAPDSVDSFPAPQRRPTSRSDTEITGATLLSSPDDTRAPLYRSAAHFLRWHARLPVGSITAEHWGSVLSSDRAQLFLELSPLRDLFLASNDARASGDRLHPSQYPTRRSDSLVAALSLARKIAPPADDLGAASSVSTATASTVTDSKRRQPAVSTTASDHRPTHSRQSHNAAAAKASTGARSKGTPPTADTTTSQPRRSQRVKHASQASREHREPSSSSSSDSKPSHKSSHTSGSDDDTTDTDTKAKRRHRAKGAHRVKDRTTLAKGQQQLRVARPPSTGGGGGGDPGDDHDNGDSGGGSGDDQDDNRGHGGGRPRPSASTDQRRHSRRFAHTSTASVASSRSHRSQRRGRGPSGLSHPTVRGQLQSTSSSKKREMAMGESAVFYRYNTTGAALPGALLIAIMCDCADIKPFSDPKFLKNWQRSIYTSRFPAADAMLKQFDTGAFSDLRLFMPHEQLTPGVWSFADVFECLHSFITVLDQLCGPTELADELQSLLDNDYLLQAYRDVTRQVPPDTVNRDHVIASSFISWFNESLQRWVSVNTKRAVTAFRDSAARSAGLSSAAREPVPPPTMLLSSLYNDLVGLRIMGCLTPSLPALGSAYTAYTTATNAAVSTPSRSRGQRRKATAASTTTTATFSPIVVTTAPTTQAAAPLRQSTVTTAAPPPLVWAPGSPIPKEVREARNANGSTWSAVRLNVKGVTRWKFGDNYLCGIDTMGGGCNKPDCSRAHPDDKGVLKDRSHLIKSS